MNPLPVCVHEAAHQCRASVHVADQAQLVKIQPYFTRQECVKPSQELQQQLVHVQLTQHSFSSLTPLKCPGCAP